MNRNSSAITAPPKRLALPDASSSKRQKTDSSETHHEHQNPPDAGVSVHASQLDIPRFSINALPRELTAKIHHLAIPPINVLSVENPETLLSSAEPMITLRLVNKAWQEVFSEQLAQLHWTYRLTRLNLEAMGTLEPNASAINALIDREVGLRNLPQAPSQHTLALMFAGRNDLQWLYPQLHERARLRANNPALSPHMDLDQLPVHALLVASLAYGAMTLAFVEFENSVLHSLAPFSTAVQAQVFADLCALHHCFSDEVFKSHKDRLDGLNTPESKAQSQMIERLKEVSDALMKPGETIDLSVYALHVGTLFGTLPPAGAPWNLSALAAMQLLSCLHQRNSLTYEQSEALVNQTTELLRHFMSLVRPGVDHPLPIVADYLQNTLALARAFMQLSSQEKARLLKTYSLQKAFEFTNGLIWDDRLPLPERLSLIDEILEVEDVSPDIHGQLKQVRSLFLNELSKQL